MSSNKENVSQETSSIAISDFLDKKATQVSFAELVGITQSGVHRHVGRCLQKGQTHRVWLHAYCEQLRNEAAGRGGDDQASLTRSRIRESDAKAAMTTVAYHEKIGTLIQASEAEATLVEWASFTVREISNSNEALIHEIESKFNISIDDDLVNNIVGPSMERIGKYAAKLGKSLTQKSNDVKQTNSVS